MQVIVFAATMFVSACLLFVVQPMIGKTILPDLGGSAGVWTTCMLFFQTILLLGYVYAHVITKRFSLKKVALIHTSLAILALPMSLLSMHWVGDNLAYPTASILVSLTISVGLPFFVISASAPLLQFLFSTTDSPSADDPYQLYAASNLGSLGALISYPFLIEPALGLDSQTWVWAGGYLVYIVGLVFCFSLSRRTTKKEELPLGAPIENATRLKWLLWAFIPSSLMLGVTQFVSTDLAPIPLLWLVPLSLYLITFIIAFSNKAGKFSGKWPLIFLLALLIPAFELGLAMIWEVIIHNLVFFFLALHFHMRLADDRPPVGRLTEFFVLLSVGGALGGLFNGIAAPFLFVQKMEYNLILALAVLSVIAFSKETEKGTTQKLIIATLVGMFLGGIFAFLFGLDRWFVYALIPAPFLFFAILHLRHQKLWKQNFGIAIAALVALSVADLSEDNYELSRSFYSTYRVTKGEHQGRETIKLVSGGTSHGEEVLDSLGKPFAYYAQESCFGELMNRPYRNVNLVGLGAGAAASYARRDSQFEFFEIDQEVVDLARKHFTYLENCGPRCKVKVGDGRRLLERSEDKSYDIIVLDAYNSDSVPTHLMTKEAFETYQSKLRPKGIIAFHVSSRYLALEKIVSSNAAAIGFDAVLKTCLTTKELQKVGPISSNRWVVIGNPENLDYLNKVGWKTMAKDGNIWTDDFTNIASAFRWD